MRYRVVVVFLAVALFALAGSADPGPDTSAATRPAGRYLGAFLSLLTDDPLVPQEWAGIWEFDEITYDCDTGTQSASDMYVDTLCTGDPIVFESDTSFTCTGTVTATTFDVTCTASFTELPGCTLHLEVQSYGTRNGDTAETTMVTRGWWTGCGFPASCDSVVGQGTRIASEPAECATPVEETSWGALKAIYR